MDIIKLRRKVKIQKFRALFDLGKQREKDIYIALLKLAEENNGIITPELIIEKFFKGRPRELGIRIIQNCKIDGLFDEEGNISEEGREALIDNKVFLNENGAYEFWVTFDPLLPQIILDIKPISVYKKENEAVLKVIEEVPKWIKYLENKKVELLNKNKDVVKVNHFLPHIEKLRNNLNVSIHFSIAPQDHSDESKLVVTGDLRKNFSEIQQYSFEEVWSSLLGRESSSWDQEKSVLLCKFDEVKETNSRINFSIDKTFPSPTILELEKFDDVTVKNIPVKPVNEKEANKWANWILEQEIKDYIDEDSYLELCNNIAMKPQLLDFEISFISQRELAKKFIKRESNGQLKFLEKYWFLQTPLDLKIKI